MRVYEAVTCVVCANLMFFQQQCSWEHLSDEDVQGGGIVRVKHT